MAWVIDSIFGAHRLDNEIDVKAGIGSTLAAFISLGGGASVGQYGPLVHFGATLGTYIRQVFGNKAIGTDVFIGCGVAAAIAAGFHAPIAGIVFAHEAVLRHFSFRALTPTAISSITSVWFSTALFGGDPLLALDAATTDLLPMVPILLGRAIFWSCGITVYAGFVSISCNRSKNWFFSPDPSADCSVIMRCSRDFCSRDLWEAVLLRLI